MTLKVRILRCLKRLFIILASLTMIWFSEKMLTSTRCIHVLMSNLIKKSCMDSNAYVCQTTYKRLKNRFRSKGFWPKYWVGFLTVRRNQFIRLATNLKLCGRYVHVFRFNVHAQNYEKPSIVHLKFDFQVGHWNQKTILTIGQKCALTRPGLNPYLHYTYSKVSIKHLFLLKDRVWIFSRSLY